jgi:VanZ family protein
MKFNNRHTPALLWGLAILIITGLPGNYVPKVHNFLELLSTDKLIHLGMFAPFSYLLAKGIFSNTGNLRKCLFVSGLIGTVYAIFTELMQYCIIPGRNGNIYDAIADIVGVSIGIYAFYRFRKFKNLI